MPRGPFAFAGAALVAVTLIPLALGAALDIYPFLYWGVLSAYLGLSWAAPGGLLGLAAAQRAERAGGRLINTLGISVGLVTGIGLLVVVATLLAVGTGDEPASADRDPVPFVPVETESSAAPTGARPGRARAESSARSRTREDRRGLVQQRRAPDVCGHVCPASCGLWIVSESDGEPRAISLAPPVEGARGSLSSGGDGAACRK